MAKKSREYWEERFAALEEAQSKRGAEYFAELEKQYNRASASVQRDIERWYTRFAVNNEITLQEARKLLTGSDLEEFHWNVMEYIEKGRTLNYSTQWARQLENASARVHVSRLEALKLQMQNHVEVLYGNELDDFAEEMKKIYTEGYYHTAYEIQKGFNIGYDLMRLDTNKIEKVISRPWAADGSNFSDRIWKQKSQLVSDLHNNLTQAIIRGQNPHVVTEAIARRFNVSKGQAGRLVMTESAFFNSASNYDCYKDLGVEQYEILATLDTKTSDICRALDGKVFDMKDYAAGVTAPPFHVWCRTTTVPYFDDEFELDTERAARDENGKTYFVPADMKYEEWYEMFVEGAENDLSGGGNGIVLTPEEAKKQLQEANTIIDNYTDYESSWSGNVIIDDDMKVKGKFVRRSGDIQLRSDSPTKTMIHELLHSRTIYDNASAFQHLKNGKLNEAAVELFAQCICKDNGISFVSSYGVLVNSLQEIASMLDYDEMDFAKKLFEIPFSERYDWLERQVYDAVDSDALSALSEVTILNDLHLLFGNVRRKK